MRPIEPHKAKQLPPTKPKAPDVATAMRAGLHPAGKTVENLQRLSQREKPKQ